MSTADQLRDGYTALESYGVLADGRSVALLSSDGRVDWWAVPNLSSAPVSSRLLDPEHGGAVRLGPRDGEANSSMRYHPGTNALLTTWTSKTGVFDVTSCLTRGDSGVLPWCELAFRVECRSGEADIDFQLRAGDGLRRWTPWVEDVGETPVVHAGKTVMHVCTPEGSRVLETADGLASSTHVVAGERVTFAVVAVYDQPLMLVNEADVDARVDQTLDFWSRWSSRVAASGERQEALVRSALALRALVQERTGAIAAAATTSLPERIGGEKNWDYRYAWVRDAAMTIDALSSLGLREEVHGALTWLLTTIRRHGPEMHTLYALDGRRAESSSERPVVGWRGSRPVRVGNRAAGQLQLGVYGELFDTVSTWVRRGHVLDQRTARQLADLADDCADAWPHDDSGIWELPETRPYTSSKMNCWRALTAAHRLAEDGHLPAGPSARWSAEAGRIKTWIIRHCWSQEQQSFTAWAGGEELDASVLLGARYGFDRTEQMSHTIDAITRRLGSGALLYRFSGAREEEETFIACAYWRVTALVLVGRHAEARSLMRELDALQPPLGLLSEMATPRGELVGNLPQALSHLAFIDAELHLQGLGGTPENRRDTMTSSKTAVVTGGSAGIGRAVVRELARRGYDVAVLARGQAGVDAAVRDVETCGQRAIGITVDVADADGLDAAADRIETEMGPIHAWINVAFAGALSYFWDTSPEEFARMTEVTYYGQVNGTRSALARMRPRDAGVIVNVSSAMAHRSIPLQAAYCGAKAAVRGMTASVLTELKATGSHVAIGTVTLPGVNTTQFGWNLNRMPGHPRPVPPIVQPEVAARAVCHMVEHPRRETWVGIATAYTVLGNRLLPGFVDWYLAKTGVRSQQTDQELPRFGANLDQPQDDEVDRGSQGPFSKHAAHRDPISFMSRHRREVNGAGVAALSAVALLTVKRAAAGGHA